MLGYIEAILVPGSVGEGPGVGFTSVGLTLESLMDEPGTWVDVGEPGSWVYRGQPGTEDHWGRPRILVSGGESDTESVSEPGFTVAGLEAGTTGVSWEPGSTGDSLDWCRVQPGAGVG